MGRYRDVSRGFFRSAISIIKICLLASFVTPSSLLGCEDAAPGILDSGTWGGRGAELRVLENYAEIEFDCAWGRIDGQIQIQPNGEFAVAGTYLREPGGPGRVGDPKPKGVPAVYSGFRNNSEIHLNVQLVETGRSIGPFVLQKSQESQLEKCL